MRTFDTKKELARQVRILIESRNGAEANTRYLAQKLAIERDVVDNYTGWLGFDHRLLVADLREIDRDQALNNRTAEAKSRALKAELDTTAPVEGDQR